MPREGSADVTLSLGHVPDHLNDPIWTSPFIEIGDSETVLLRWGERVRILARAGRELILDTAPGTDGADIEAFLLGAVAGVLLHQRSELALHASCVAIDGKAVAISGPSGRGKSTLAAALAAEGHQLLTDDVCRILFAEGRAWSVPGSSRLRLWPDAAAALHHTPDNLAPGRSGHAKRLLVLPPASPSPIPLAMIVRLSSDARVTVPSLTRLSGTATMARPVDVLYRAGLGRRMGRRLSLFRDFAHLLSIVPSFSLTRTGNMANLPELVELLVSAVREA